MSPAVNFDEDAINSAEDEEAVTTIAVRERFELFFISFLF